MSFIRVTPVTIGRFNRVTPSTMTAVAIVIVGVVVVSVVVRLGEVGIFGFVHYMRIILLRSTIVVATTISAIVVIVVAIGIVIVIVVPLISAVSIHNGSREHIVWSIV